MSEGTLNADSLDVPFYGESKLNVWGDTGETPIPLHDGNGTFHMTSIMVNILQVKWLYWGQSS